MFDVNARLQQLRDGRDILRVTRTGQTAVHLEWLEASRPRKATNSRLPIERLIERKTQHMTDGTWEEGSEDEIINGNQLADLRWRLEQIVAFEAAA